MVVRDCPICGDEVCEAPCPKAVCKTCGDTGYVLVRVSHQFPFFDQSDWSMEPCCDCYR